MNCQISSNDTVSNSSSPTGMVYKCRSTKCYRYSKNDFCDVCIEFTCAEQFCPNPCGQNNFCFSCAVQKNN